MCYGCFLRSGDSVLVGQTHRLGSATELRSIDPELLIAPDFRAFTTQLVVPPDGVLDLYLHRPAGVAWVQGGGYGAQWINTLAIDDGLHGFLQTALAQLDDLIQLDFRFTDQEAQGDLRLYLDTEINTGDDGITLGIALTNSVVDRHFWELFINTPAFAGQELYLRYALLHEIGHALGLEHPFDRTDGDVFVSGVPAWSAFPEETLMAYRDPLLGAWPTWFSSNDIQALQRIWGVEMAVDPLAQRSPQRLIGSNEPDRLTGGLAGDLLLGHGGHDILIGGAGADELWGGRGSNRFSSAPDGAVDWLLITPDGSANRRVAGRSIDVIEVLGSEDRVAVLGASTQALRVRRIKLNTREHGRLSGFGISIGQRLEAIYTGDLLQRQQLQACLLGVPEGFAGSWG
jgi:hypothetical protein